MPLPTTVTPSDSLRAFALGPETLTAGTGVSAGVATYMELLPVKSYKNDLQDVRMDTQEMVATLIRDTSTVRLFKHNDLTYATYSRFDKVGWLMRNAIGTPVTVASGSTSTDCTQTITLGSTGAGMLTTEVFNISIGGYTTSPITWTSTAAGLAPRITAACVVLPSVVTCGTTGSVNITVSPGTFTASTATLLLSCGTNLAHVNMPLFGVSTNSVAGATGFAMTQAGIGSYKHTFTVGASGKLPLTYGEYDGVSYKLCQSGAIDTIDLAATLTDAPLWSVKAIAQAEVDYQSQSTATISAFPNYYFTNYVNSMDPTQLTFNIGGTLAATGGTITGGAVTSTVLDLKLSGKNNRKTLNTMGGGSGDMVRATEGVTQWLGKMKLRYTAYTASQYSNYVTNTTPGSFILQWQDTATFIGAAAGAANHPTMNIVMTNPKYNEGARLPDSAEPEQELGFKALLDQTNGTSLTFVLVNETPRYTTLT